MPAFLKKSPRGLKRTRRALDELAKAVRRLNERRDTHGILPRLRPMLGDINRELKAYETMVSEGEGFRVATRGFRFHLSLLSTEIKHAEMELKIGSGLTHPRRSPVESLYGPLEKLRNVSRQLDGLQTDFQHELNRLIRKSGVTLYALAALRNRDPSFIYKLMNGERRKPTRDSVTRIATSLMEFSSKISEKDANRLLHSAGYPPLKRQ